MKRSPGRSFRPGARGASKDHRLSLSSGTSSRRTHADCLCRATSAGSPLPAPRGQHLRVGHHGPTACASPPTSTVATTMQLTPVADIDVAPARLPQARRLGDPPTTSARWVHHRPTLPAWRSSDRARHRKRRDLQLPGYGSGKPRGDDPRVTFANIRLRNPASTASRARHLASFVERDGRAAGERTTIGDAAAVVCRAGHPADHHGGQGVIRSGSSGAAAMAKGNRRRSAGQAVIAVSPAERDPPAQPHIGMARSPTAVSQAARTPSRSPVRHRDLSRSPG